MIAPHDAFRAVVPLLAVLATAGIAEI